MQSITYQPFLRPALPEVNGCKEYREERQLFIRIDELLHTSGLENDFIELCLQHRGEDLEKTSAKRLASIARHSVLALRSNIARHYKSLDHRDFCILQRLGLHAPRDTLNHWTLQSLELLRPIAEAIHLECLAENYLQLDDWSGATKTA